ncbi:MAG: cob(I)yrinic acid a,c-diamide adenosyltransferase [Gammaproteobacteria bacterium]|nr:cob(I)yrinic acid a,c-diamide adenosyltransferase [Gammaproteobacteria bacterium]MCP4091572.1 cob(I)yrinic acid a,c-diamide adenosyltransferase [Gammaproteobacteria bacterium]MCP4276068.1 cob(I)yrinic acid a,c-diamide adenosyltransferase [Gammaproteobacteria bacterium]MCP4832560.1 cob(I)yrinic acid a,c-diamide adenosyltransferase [Gammaproteobacteria bacterium]MCP4929638.1 cob(I)yrinic acid a,c-diamide adenosyltransferase [Gammaproteobacteria bacterium]
MGNRLSKIYTRTGDDGTTGLGNGKRVRKDDLRVEAYGTVDELNSAIGILAASDLPTEFSALIAGIQQRLFDLGGELSIPDTTTLSDAAIQELEHTIDSLNQGLPPLKDFILPGGTITAAACHMARAICRRSERKLITLAATEYVNDKSICYLNRLSDLLFVLSRTLNKRDDEPEVLWQGGRGNTD